MASSPCSNFSGNEKACVKRKDWCIWQGQNNLCVPAATEEECAKKEKRISCRKLRCSWDRHEKKCLLSRSTREAEKPEVGDLDTTPRPDEDGEPDRDGDFDIMPVPDRDGDFDIMPVPDRDGDFDIMPVLDRDGDFNIMPVPNKDGEDDMGKTSEFLETLKEMDVEDALQEIEKHYGNRYRVYVCPRENPDVQCLMRNFDDHRIKLGVNKENVVENPTVG
jgi:hypothetical protein